MPQDPPPVRSTRATARQQLFKAGEKRERAAPLTEVEALLASAGPAPEEPVRRRVAQQGASGLRPAVAAAIAGAGAAELAAAAVAEHAHEEGTDEDLASVGGIPTSLLRGVLNNKEARDVVLSRLPAELRDMLCERALGTDVVELVFAVTHGKLGSHFDLPTLRGSLASTSFVAGLAAQPEAERGFAMGPVSKSYACYSAEAGSSRWNDGTALPGGPRHGYHLAMHAKRAMRKANGSAQVAAVRTFHKNMGGL
ncbi:hypothetical protein N2152v2_004466 [Parachlorella kessleri]